MVSTRPSPTPVRGRVVYPSATSYVPGDADNSPTYVGTSELVGQFLSRDPDRDAQGLKTWWKTFQRTEPQRIDGRGVFGVPLSRSLEYASVQISTAGPEGDLNIWGVIPVVVAKCGLYLKENATEVEGTFRISGSAKRMKDLQAIFETGPKYGKDIDWTALSFTTHDVATIFRRFFTQMPEPIVPFDFYEEFRSTLSEESLDETISQYKSLIQALPSYNHYLLLYVLDVLSVFAKKSDVNLMTVPNLALIFQPGILSHPIHAMRPRDHVLSQRVLELLIENQDHFLIGMQVPKRKTRKEKPSLATPSPSSPVPSSFGPVPASPSTPAAPPLVRADSDLMLPSESDDEVPAGGYYVFEGAARPELSPKSPATSPHSPPTTSLDANLLPQKPIRPSGGFPKSSRPIIETMEPSDSDEEVPPGGYVVQSADPSARAAFLTRASICRIQSRASEVGSSISRRKTMPSKSAGASTRPRRHAEEAP